MKTTLEVQRTMKIALALATLAVLVIAVGIASRATAQASDCVSGGVVPASNDDLTADCKTDDDGDGGIVISTPTPLPTSSVSEMVKRVRPAVVKISAPGYQPYAIGSGFIFATVPTEKTAYLLTNYHVVEGEPKLAVMVNDSDWYEPKVAFLDARRDLAVLEICCAEFTSVPFADSDLLSAGDEVIAIGYPRDTAMPRDLTLSRVIVPGEASVTRGMISAFRYSSLMDAQLVQTDTAVSSGNSGGPLLTLDGQIVAMNTLASNHHPGDGVTQNINFSVLENTIQEKLRIWAEGPTSQFGPDDVSIPDAGGDLIGLYTLPDFEATDDEFQITATFVNPSTPFSYGFRFGVRKTDDDPFMYFTVHSDKEWSLLIYEPDKEDRWTTTLSGTVPQLKTGKGAKNTLRLLVDGKYGALAVNGIPVYFGDERISPHIDLGSERSITAHGGHVGLATGIYRGTGKDSATEVEDVTATTYSHQPATVTSSTGQ
ncbi:MAG: trypsin-like serine protease [Dehalococcoidia bacterium]|nr:trypsin-like serine protease [Dehalococcoidia bacterium]